MFTTAPRCANWEATHQKVPHATAKSQARVNCSEYATHVWASFPGPTVVCAFSGRLPRAHRPKLRGVGRNPMFHMHFPVYEGGGRRFAHRPLAGSKKKKRQWHPSWSDRKNPRMSESGTDMRSIFPGMVISSYSGLSTPFWIWGDA